MSRHAGDNSASRRDGEGVIHRHRRCGRTDDDLLRSRQSLIELMQRQASSPAAFITRYPLAAAAAAFVGGVLFVRVPAVRGLLKIALMWGVKDALRSLDALRK